MELYSDTCTTWRTTGAINSRRSLTVCTLGIVDNATAWLTHRVEQVERWEMSYRFRSRLCNPLGRSRFLPVAIIPVFSLSLSLSRLGSSLHHRNRVHHHRGDYFPNEFPGDDWQYATDVSKYTVERKKIYIPPQREISFARHMGFVE